MLQVDWSSHSSLYIKWAHKAQLLNSTQNQWCIFLFKSLVLSYYFDPCYLLDTFPASTHTHTHTHTHTNNHTNRTKKLFKKKMTYMGGCRHSYTCAGPEQQQCTQRSRWVKSDHRPSGPACASDQGPADSAPIIKHKWIISVSSAAVAVHLLAALGKGNLHVKPTGVSDSNLSTKIYLCQSSQKVSQI